ncbi:MAG: PAS domain S-box protein [Chloroflexi bacterium]|nr:PAS domain S-box protein [Chloroflexota bacterium]
MNNVIHILHLEDDAADAELVKAILESAMLSCQIFVVRTRDEFSTELCHGGYDIIIADYRLPAFDGMSALRLAREQYPDIPFIFVSGALGEDAAIQGLREGATDYVLKQNLSRLAPAVERALREAENRHERKRAEERITQLAAIVQSTDDAIIGKTLDGIITSWNRGAERTYGYTESEVIGKSISILALPGHEQEITKLLADIKAGKHIEHFETVRRRKDGQEIHVSLTVSPVRDAEGNIIAASTIARDITMQKRDEEALRKTNQLLERVFSTTEFLLAYLDADFNFLRVNLAYAQADEKTPEFFIGKNHFALYPDAENEEIFRQVIQTGKPYVALAKPFIYAEHPERGMTYWNWTLQPVRDATGCVTGLVMILINVTERERAIVALHESEERFRAVAESANEGIISVHKSEIVYWNKAAQAIFGYTAKEILGQSIATLIPSEDLERYREIMRQRNVEDDPHPTANLVEAIALKKGGTKFPIEASVGSWQTHDGAFFTAMVRDITDRKHHESEREAIITVANILRSAPTRAEMLPVLLDQLLDLFQAVGATLAMQNPVTGETLIELGRGAVGKDFTGIKMLPGEGISGRVIASGKPYLSNDIQNDKLFLRPDLLNGAKAAACVPLLSQDRPFGAIWILSKNPIDETMMRLLMAIADIAANAIHRTTLHEQTQRRLDRLTALHHIDTTISASLELQVSLNVLLSNLVAQLGVDAADIMAVNSYAPTLEYAAGFGFRTRNIEHSIVRLGVGQAGRTAQERRLGVFPELHHARIKFERAILLRDEGFVSHFVAPLIAKGQIEGVLEVFHRSRIEPELEWLEFLETLASRAAIAIDNAALFKNLELSNAELSQAYDATIQGWSAALDLRDKETEGHTLRVTELTLRLAARLGMRDTELVHVRRGTLLHDIGKMGIPDGILLKPGALTAEEWEIMRLHPVYAYDLLSPIAYLRPALDIPFCHHEKWDGTGYPRGLKDEEIPLAARIFSIVDVWDALSNDRPYRPKWSVQEATEYIKKEDGKSFDPMITQAFLKLIVQA